MSEREKFEVGRNRCKGVGEMSLEDDEFEQDIPGKVWKWEVWPSPYESDCDYFVTDSDERAREAILLAAEMHLWDSNDGEERTLKVVHNKDAKEPS